MENTEEKFKSGINEIRKLSMTGEEKARVLQNIFNAEPEVAQESYFIFRSFYYKKSPRHFAYVTSLSLMVVFLFGSSVLASAGSLPGSVFYPLKVGVMEPVQSVLTFSPEAKARLYSELAVRRLVEAESLADRNELDEEKEEKLNLLLEKHSEKVGQAITKLRADNPEGEAEEEEIIVNFETRMNTHAEALDVFQARNKKPEDFATLMQASETSQKVKISENARARAIGLRAMFTSEEADETEDEKDENENEGEVRGVMKKIVPEVEVEIKEEKEIEKQGSESRETEKNNELENTEAEAEVEIETEVKVETETQEEEAEPILENTENKVRDLLPL